jgi:subtilisin family serine protease
MFKKLFVIGLISSLSFSTFSQSEISGSYYDLKELSSNYVSWGVNPSNPASINLVSAWSKFKKKKEIVVAVVDTGIDRTHPFLEKNIHVQNGKIDENNFGVDFSKDRKIKGAPFDQHGHGTHVSGIIKSIFPDVKILANTIIQTHLEWII